MYLLKKVPLIIGLINIITFSAPLRIGYVVPADEYASDQSLTWLRNHLESNYDVKSFWFNAIDGGPGSFSNIDELDSVDVLVVYIRRTQLNPTQTTQFQNFFNYGKGVVGIRTASHAIQSWDNGIGLDRVVLGGAYEAGASGTGSTYTLEMTNESVGHPIFEGFTPFQANQHMYYQVLDGNTVSADATIYMYGDDGSGRTRTPITWSRKHMGGQIFYTSTGTQEDFQLAGFQKMIVNTVFWVAASSDGVQRGCLDVNASNFDSAARVACVNCCQTTAVFIPSLKPNVEFLVNEVKVNYAGKSELSIINSKGRLIRNKKNKGNHVFKVSNLEPGIYWIKVNAGNNSFINKVIYLQ